MIAESLPCEIITPPCLRRDWRSIVTEFLLRFRLLESAESILPSRSSVRGRGSETCLQKSSTRRHRKPCIQLRLAISLLLSANMQILSKICCASSRPLLHSAQGSPARAALRPCRASLTGPPAAPLRPAEPLTWLHHEKRTLDELEDFEDPVAVDQMDAIGLIGCNFTGLDMNVFYLEDFAFEHEPRLIVSCQYGPEPNYYGNEGPACHMQPQWHQKTPGRSSMLISVCDMLGAYFMLTVEDHPKIAGDAGEIHEKDIQRARQFVVGNQASLLEIWNQAASSCDSTWDNW